MPHFLFHHYWGFIFATRVWTSNKHESGQKTYFCLKTSGNAAFYLCDVLKPLFTSILLMCYLPFSTYSSLKANTPSKEGLIESECTVGLEWVHNLLSVFSCSLLEGGITDPYPISQVLLYPQSVGVMCPSPSPFPVTPASPSHCYHQ